MKGMQFEPVDTLFFRGGTPFTMDRDPQEDVSSVFPPHPPSMAGVVRAALALANGWDGRSRWPAGTEKVLGSGPDNLGDISLAGPFVLRNSQPLFPLPRHVVGKDVQGVWQPRMLLRLRPPRRLRPGKDVRLPEPPRDGSAEIAQLEATDDIWVSRAGLSSVLRGDIPAVGESPPSRFMGRGTAYWVGERNRHAYGSGRHALQYAARTAKARCLAGRSRRWGTDHMEHTFRTACAAGESRLVEVREWNGAVDVDMPWRRSARAAVSR